MMSEAPWHLQIVSKSILSILIYPCKPCRLQRYRTRRKLGNAEDKRWQWQRNDRHTNARRTAVLQGVSRQREACPGRRARISRARRRPHQRPAAYFPARAQRVARGRPGGSFAPTAIHSFAPAAAAREAQSDPPLARRGRQPIG